MLNSHYLFNDGLTSNCQNNNGTEWTYNQGVILGGLYQLYQIEHSNMTYINLAKNIFYDVINYITYQNTSILHELESSNSVRSSSDQSQFKGIYMRYLFYMYQYLNTENINGKFDDFLKDIRNFVSIQQNGVLINAMNPTCDCQFDAVWTDNYVQNTGIGQTSAVDALNGYWFIM